LRFFGKCKKTGKVILAADEPVKCLTLVRPKPAAAKKPSVDCCGKKRVDAAWSFVRRRNEEGV
jgi:hypothetical protein